MPSRCGDAYRARPFETRTDAAGSYRIHLRVLTRDAFHGCIEVAAVGVALVRSLVATILWRQNREGGRVS